MTLIPISIARYAYCFWTGYPGCCVWRDPVTLSVSRLCWWTGSSRRSPPRLTPSHCCSRHWTWLRTCPKVCHVTCHSWNLDNCHQSILSLSVPCHPTLTSRYVTMLCFAFVWLILTAQYQIVSLEVSHYVILSVIDVYNQQMSFSL